MVTPLVACHESFEAERFHGQHSDQICISKNFYRFLQFTYNRVNDDLKTIKHKTLRLDKNLQNRITFQPQTFMVYSICLSAINQVNCWWKFQIQTRKNEIFLLQVFSIYIIVYTFPSTSQTLAMLSKWNFSHLQHTRHNLLRITSECYSIVPKFRDLIF